MEVVVEHNRVCLATDDVQDLALERCECGEYSLSIGAVTIQMAPEQMEALARMLGDSLADGAEVVPTAIPPGEIQ